MRLYSVQPLSVWNDLSEGRVVTARPFDSASSDAPDQTWRGAYEWLARQMRERGVQTLPEHDAPAFPMWAWHWYNGHRKKRPDLRHRMMREWAQTQRMALLTLDVDEHRVQLSDYDGWHWCLNYWFLGRPRETNAFQREVKDVLKTDYYREKPLPDPVYDARLQRSWERMFDLPAMRTLLDTSQKHQIVQGTLWHLARPDVTSALEFGAGRPSRPIDFATHPTLPEQGHALQFGR